MNNINMDVNGKGNIVVRTGLESGPEGTYMSDWTLPVRRTTKGNYQVWNGRKWTLLYLKNESITVKVKKVISPKKIIATIV